MLLLHCSPRVHLHCLSPSRSLPIASSFHLPGRRLRRFTALRAEQELPPPAAVAEPPDADAEGPVELLTSTLFSTDDNPTPLQTATSLLTGAISIFLFRSLRRRARHAKEPVIPSLLPLYLACTLQQKTDAFHGWFIGTEGALEQVKKKPNNHMEEAWRG